MSRTYRKYSNCFRKPTTLNTLKKEQKAYEEIKYYGEEHCRLSVRANRSSGAIPSSYDDLSYATRERVKSSLKYRFLTNI